MSHAYGRLTKVCLTLVCFVLTFGLSFSAWAAGGDMLWQYDVAAAGKQEAKAAAFDSAGNTIITGFFEGASSDFHTVKVKADGSGTAWTASLDFSGGGDVASAVAVDANDDVLVTGYVWNGTNYDIHIVKYAAATGAVLWQHTYNGAAGGNDFATAVAVDSINNVYVGGYQQDASGKDDYLVLKYGPGGPNPDGTPLWQVSYNGPDDGHDRITAITAGSDGIAVTGESQNATPDFDCLTLKYGFDGGLLWERRYSDTGDGKGQAVRMDAAGNVVMTGYVSNGSDRDFYTAKYPAGTGPAEWVKIYDGGFDDEATALWIDSAGDVYVTGTTFSLTSGQDVYTARYAGGSGAETWSSSYNSGNGDNDLGLGIVADESGEVFVTGYDDNAASGFDDYLMLKYKKADGTLLWDRAFDGAGKNDRPVGVGLAPDGEVLVAGWSDRWTAGASDYDYYALSYDPGALNPPTSLTAQTVSNTEIVLNWSDNSAVEDGFTLERKIGAFGSYSEIATLPADTVAYNDTGLPSDIRYYYRLRAYNATASSPYSNEADAKTTVVSYDPPTRSFQFNGADDGEDYAEAIAIGPDNHPVVTGFSFDLVGAFDYYTVKLDRADASELWNARYNDGDNEMDVASAVTVDSDNNVLVTGYSSLYGGGDSNTNDVYTIGYPAGGPPQAWDDQYNGPAGDDDRSSAVASALDGSNNTAVVGYGKNASWNDDIYVLKYQPDGTRVWAATPYDGGGDDYPVAVGFDSAGDVLVAGRTHNGSNFDFFVAKYRAADGSRAWVDTFNGAGNGDDYAEALAIDAAGDLYVAGYSVNAAGNGDFYTIKYEGSSGARLWERAHNGAGNGYDVASAVQFDPVNGEIIVAGTSFIGTGNHDFHIIRYNPAGDIVWQKTLDRPTSDESVAAMSVDRSGIVCVTGTTNAGSDDDVLAVKYDHVGTVIGAVVYNGSAGSDDSPAAIATNALGEAFVAGYTTNASGNADYLVFLADGEVIQTPTPFTAVQLYTQIDLSWTDNSLNEDGFRLERKVGSCASASPWGQLYTAPAGTSSFSNLDLSIGSSYCYRIQSFNSSGESSRWAELEVTTADPVPPGALAATVLNSTDIELNWTDNTTGEDGFVIQRCTGAGCDFTVSDSFSVAADTTSYTDTSACYGQTYSYRIKAYKTAEWVTAYSNVAADSVTVTPAAPTAFTVTWISEVQADLAWTDNTDDETGFKIERCAGISCSDFAEVGSVAADEVAYNDTGLFPNTLYRYRVTPYKSSPCSWDPFYSTIEEVTTTPQVPSALEVAAAASTQMNIAWTDETASEDGFKIERCQGIGCSDFTQITTVGAGVTMYADSSVCDGQEYSYRVRAYKSGLWDTPYTVVGTDTVLSPPVPGDFVVTAASEEGIDLDWTVTGGDAGGYLLERCQGAGCIDFAQLADVPTGKLLHFQMEEAAWDGTVDEIKDSSGNGNHGRSYNGATTAKDGKIGWGGDFDGSNDYIYTPLTIDQTSTSAGATFEAWVYPYSTSADWRFVVSTENGGYDWSLARYGTTWRLYHGSNNWSAVAVTPNAWQHLVAVFEPGVGVRLYKDGVKYSSTSIAYDTSTGTVQIGRRSSGSYHFDGKIDEVIVYNRALSDAEAQARYTAGKNSEKYSDTGLPPSTTYGYRLKSYRNGNCASESIYTAATYATTLAPPPPTVLAAISPNTTEVDLSWSDNTDSETGFVIERCLGTGTACDEDSEFSLLTTTGPDVVSYADLSTCSGNTYTYRVAAEKTDGPVWQTSWAASAEATTDTAVTPADFAATPVSEVRIDLSWTDSIADEDSYRIEKCVGSGIACDEDAEFSLLASYADRNLMSEATLWLKMDEASWGAVINSAAAGSNGTKYGNAATQADADRGNVGWFDGSGDYLRFGHYAGITPSGAITVSTWARSFAATWQHDHALMSKRNAFILSPRAGDTGMRFYIYSGGWRVIDVPAIAIDITEWHQYTGTYDGANIILYVDGVEVGRTPYVGTIGADTGYLEIGRDDGNGRYHKGWMDDALIYDRGLDAAEVQTLYQSTQPTQYKDEGLSPSTDYTYRLRASKTVSCPWTTAWEVRTATTLAPPPPTDFVATAADTTRVDLTWTDNSGSETAYSLERCDGSGTACDEDLEFNVLDGILAPDTASYSDSTVCEGATYTYRVRAEKDDGPIWQTTWAGPLAETTPAKASPGSLVATRISEVQIELSWTDNTADETGFKIERCAGAGCTDFVEVATPAADATSYQDDQLVPDTTYSYKIRAFKSADCGWTTGYANTAAATTTVFAPSALVATAVNTTQIDLSWTDNTATETGTVIERCTGTGCSDFAELDEVGPNVISYADSSVCNATTYNYRLKARNDGLSYNGGGCWTRRAPVTFSGFAPDINTEIVVPYDADMRADFGDIRFYDAGAMRELPYWIRQKTDGVSATVMVALGGSDNIYLYYGNPGATDSGREAAFIEFADDFQGSGIDGNKWVEIDPNGSIAQNDDLLLNDVSDAWNKALISKATFARVAGKEIYLSLSIPADTPGNNHFMVGWELNQTGNASYNQLVHGLYWNNYTLTTYEKGSHTGGSSQTYAASTDYEAKIVLKSVGAKYYVRGGAYSDWVLVKETSTYGDATMRLAFTQYSHQAAIHSVEVKGASIDSGAALGAEEADACFGFNNTWVRGYSNEDEATTTAPVAPSGLAATAVTDTQVDLAWTDNTDAESGFEIERCTGTGCSDFAQIDTVGGDVTTYSDATAPPSTNCSYRVRAYKSASCPWDSGYSNTASDLSFPATTSGLTATALNSRMIQLDWVDDAVDEDGYEVEVQVWNGRFVQIDIVPPDETTFTDTMSIEPEKEYRYRVRPFRGADNAPFSNEAAVTTPARQEGDGTCAP